MHRLLARQLKKLGLTAGAPPTQEQWEAVLGRVSASYADADQDRYTIERSLEISSREMQRLYQDLQRSSQTELAVERDKLAGLAATLHATVDASPDAIIVVDGQGRVVKMSRRFVELFEVPPELASSTDVEALLRWVLQQMRAPDAVLRGVRAIQAAPATSLHDEVEMADGRIFERFLAPILLACGAVVGRVWFFRDVTQERRADAEVRGAHQFLDSIVENIPDMVFVKEAETLRFVRFNRAGEELLGVGRDDLVGRSDADLFPPEQAWFFTAKDRAVLAGRAVVDIPEEPINTPRGLRLLHTKKIPILDEAGCARYLLGISRDITDAKRAEHELREAKDAAEHASRAKTGFLSNMSHEMRTPLNSIIGFARVLETERFGALADRQREYVGYILRASRHMLHLVNDLLDLRRLEENRAAVAATRLAIGPLVDEALQLVKSLVDEREHVVDVALATELPQAIADQRAIVQILVNLLGNAAKFTPPRGRISVRATADAEVIRIAVSDTGVGIADADQAKLFTYYTQLGAKHDHHMQGSGIGLALTRGLVEKMGGAITVQSAHGVGSTFEFSVPRCSEAP